MVRKVEGELRGLGRPHQEIVPEVVGVWPSDGQCVALPGCGVEARLQGAQKRQEGELIIQEGDCLSMESFR